MNFIQLYTKDKRIDLTKLDDGRWLVKEFAIIDAGMHQEVCRNIRDSFSEAIRYLFMFYPEVLEFK